MSLPTGLTYTGFNGALTQVNGGGTGLSGALVYGRNPTATRIARELKGIKNLPLRVILRALAAGGSGQAIANGTYARRVAATGMSPQGGVIAIETAQTNGTTGNTAAGDITIVNADIFNDDFAPTASQYATAGDRSGNGGGGKGKF